MSHKQFSDTTIIQLYTEHQDKCNKNEEINPLLFKY